MGEGPRVTYGLAVLRSRVQIAHVNDSNPITVGTHSLKAGNHKLGVEIKSVNKQVVPGDMVGVNDVYLAKKANCHATVETDSARGMEVDCGSND